MIYSKKIIIFLFSFSLFFILATSVSAQTVSDNYFVSGDKLTISGDYEKDVFILGNDVNFDGQVGGDLFVVGQAINIKGTVGGNLYAVSNEAVLEVEVAGSLRGVFTQATVKGKVARNLTLLGTDLTSDVVASWHTAVNGKKLNLLGSAQRWDITGDYITFLGQSTGDVYIKNPNKSGYNNIESAAKIDGNLYYQGEPRLDVKSEVELSGQIIYKPDSQLDEKNDFGFSQIFWWLVNVFGLITVGLVLISILGKKLLIIADAYETQNFKYLWTGLITFLLVPILCLVLAFTFIGLSLALILILLYIASFYFTQIFVSIWLGEIILKKFSPKPKLTTINKNYLFWSLVIGVIVWCLLIQIPFMGDLLVFLAFIFTLGIFVNTYKSYIKTV
jgi:hypothetical protein